MMIRVNAEFMLKLAYKKGQKPLNFIVSARAAK